MTDFVRVAATCISDSFSQPDPDWCIVLTALVQGDRLISGECFGKAVEGEHGTWPFALEPPTGPETMGKFNFGAGFNGPEEDTNIFDKPIQVGELFTRWYLGAREWTYQITHVISVA